MDSLHTSTGDKRKKVALKPGYSLMSWVNLCNSGEDLSGTGGEFLNISLNTLKLHNSRSDAWLAINGVVYNVTKYLPFHPGGEDELMRGVGTDATKLFNQVHSWVNYQSLLRCCAVGRLMTSLTLSPSSSNKLDIKDSKIPKEKRFSPPLPVHFENVLSMSTNKQIIRKIDWYQQMKSLCIVFYVVADLLNVYVSLLRDNELSVIVNDEEWKLKLEKDIYWPCDVKMKNTNVEIHLTKMCPSLWTNYATSCKCGSKSSTFDKMIVQLNLKLTHNTKLIGLSYTDKIINYIPVGCHVQLKQIINGDEVERPYTPVPVIFNEKDQSIIFSRAPSSVTVLYFIIKSYVDGVLSKGLCVCTNGDVIYMSRPSGSFSTTLFKDKTKLKLLAAGTGLSPLLSILLWTLQTTESLIELVLFNKTEADMILEKEINSLSKKYTRLTVNKIVGMQVTKELIHSVVPSFSSEIFVCISGPNKFNEISLESLKEIGYSDSDYYCFV